MTSLAEFIEEHREGITRAVLRAYPPVYSARNRDEWGIDLRRLHRRPLGGQADAIRALVVSLQQHRGTNLVGEMGTGKTTIATAAAYLAGFRRVLVLCPPHLVRKWQREVEATVPRARAVVAATPADLVRLGTSDRPTFVIVSRERAKLSYRWKPAAIPRPSSQVARGDGEQTDARRLRCPQCFAPLLDREGVPLDLETLGRRKHTCARCGSALWQADRTGPRRYPLADYVARRMPGAFDLLLVDEQHEYKARGSAQGIAAGTLAEACGRTLTLTGTLMGGYASTLFHLLWRFSPEVREEFGYGDEARWVSRYGIVERITKRGDDDLIEDGRSSRRRGYRTRTVEKPGVSPAVLFHLIGNTVFLRLADVADDLPEYREEVRLLTMQRGSGDEPSQASAYQRLASDLHAAVVQALAAGSRRLLAAYLQALLAYPDACTQGEEVRDPASGAVLASAPALPEERRYPKEQALLELVQEERRHGRRVLVYITHTGTRDIAPRLERVLGDAGVRVATLKADTVAPDRREAWVERRVHEGVDVLLVHPRLVQTGLDLIAFPTIAWYEVDYSVYSMRQASRRSWRIGQRLPVRVVHFAYRATLQAQALQLTARKLQASLAVEGELVDEGLAAHGDDGDDFLLTLARSLGDSEQLVEECLELCFGPGQATNQASTHLSDAREAEAADSRPLCPPEAERSSGVADFDAWQEVAMSPASVEVAVGDQLRLL